ncbi:MAG: hypothetical protein DRH30_09785 [Deltaproteobacteria bacterium]|nr:MAG: hypothetical protein DRH30_09785 [Deltaproteobacteria bacterium]
MQPLERFFRDLDSAWSPIGPQPIRLTIIGSAALMLQASYERGTKDSDILETREITPAVAEQLKRLAGRETRLAKRHRLHVDIVRNGLPFLPQRLNCHKMHNLNAGLSNFEVEVLDVVDVVVSKLKRFNGNDRADIGSMIDLELVPRERLIERFRDASDYFSCDDRAVDLPKYLANLHHVERDLMGLSPTDVRLPDWI